MKKQIYLYVMDISLVGEKLKYLISTQLPKEMKILDFEIDGAISQSEGEKFLSEYVIHLKIDDYSFVDAEVGDISYSLEKIAKILNSTMTKYAVGYRGKISRDLDLFNLLPARIIEVGYVYGEKFETVWTLGGLNE